MREAAALETATFRRRVVARSHSPGSVAVRAALAGGVLLVLIMWWNGTSADFARAPGTLATTIGELSGLVGGYLICAQVLLVARVPWFENAVGLDRLVAWHRTLGTAVILLIATHIVFIVFGLELTQNSTPWRALVESVTVFPDMLTALIGTIAILVAGLTSARLIRRYLSYEVWYWVHVATYVALFLTFFHELSGGTHFVDNPVNRFAWIVLYLATGAAVVCWRLALPLQTAWRHRLRVEAITTENSGTTSVWLRGRRLDELGIRAGQFMLFRFFSRGHLLSAHPYSISRVPISGMLRITVGALGDHSRAITSLKPGTIVFAEGPFGHFTADRATQSRVVLIAGGAGIGPIAALAAELSDRGHSVTLIYRARSVERLALVGELSSMPGVAVIPVVGRRADLGYDPLSALNLRRLVPDLRHTEVFVCGPEGMARQAERAVTELRVPRRFVHREELSLA